MLTDDIRPFRYESLFHCVIDRTCVDPECINGSSVAPIQKAPYLKLNEHGLDKIDQLLFAGGRHRIRAITLIKEERQEKLDKLQKAFKAEQEKAGNSTSKTLERIQDDIAHEVNGIAALGIWGVVLYDAGQCLER
jgi:hypothetical protein